ncbi:MAG TPA: hypothetical protein DCL21_07140 [Alphaproteobacteria bacterium]|nr:hypothetical protein [Alphaproteobacteria bacterium]
MSKYCKHCKQKNPSINELFCCNGCAQAYQLVQELNLTNFYSYRPNDIKNKKVDLDNIPSLKDNFIFENEDQTKTVNLVAEGVECAACCWLIENALYKLKGVKKVQISLFNKKLIVTFNENIDPQNIIHRVYSLGYKVYPFSHSLLEKLHEKKKKKLLMQMAVAAFFSMNIMLFSVSMWFGDDLSSDLEQLFKVFSFILAIPAVVYSGSEFFKSAVNSIKQKSGNMDVAISVAIILSFSYSAYHTFIGSGEVYFESSLMLIFFLLVGRFLEFKTKEKITLLTENIILSDIKQTTILKNGKAVDINSKDLKKGDLILLQKGEKLATDAILLDAIASFDTSSTTGEVDSKDFSKNQEINAGSILLSDSVKLQAINSFKDNSISQIAKIIEQAKTSKTKLQNLAEKIAKLYVPVVHIFAFISFFIAVYYFNTGFEEGFSRAIAVLIITCPCALALAIPVANTALLSRLYQKGILVKNADVLESIDQINAICYDKTGTLIDVDIAIPSNLSIRELKSLKALTLRSKHVLSKKIYNQLLNIEDVELKNFKEKSGFGVKGTYYAKEYILGSSKFCKTDSDASLIFRSADKVYELKVVQKLNDNVLETTNFFDLKGFVQTIISGDKESNVKHIAKQLNIAYLAEKTPLEKVEEIKNISQKSKIIYLGDGINDAAALVSADVSISFSKANEIAQNSADVIMQNNDFSNLEYFYKQSLNCKKRIKQNLGISLFYNVFAIPFAVFGMVSPFFAALLMSSSSICVILNTIRK